MIVKFVFDWRLVRTSVALVIVTMVVLHFYVVLMPHVCCKKKKQLRH
jgi:hypothetical protein